MTRERDEIDTEYKWDLGSLYESEDEWEEELETVRNEIEEISTGEPLMLTVGTATTVGAVTSARSGECEVSLKRPVCAETGAQIAINRRVGARWRLIGIGTLT